MAGHYGSTWHLCLLGLLPPAHPSVCGFCVAGFGVSSSLTHVATRHIEAFGFVTDLHCVDSL